MSSVSKDVVCRQDGLGVFLVGTTARPEVYRCEQNGQFVTVAVRVKGVWKASYCYDLSQFFEYVLKALASGNLREDAKMGGGR